MRGVRFVELDASRRVTRHAVDQVNNNLTAQLLWCAKHVEPVWVYNDGSFECARGSSMSRDARIALACFAAAIAFCLLAWWLP